VGKTGAVLACLLFAVPFGGVGVFASWAIGSAVHGAWKARDWVPVPATVESASLATSESDEGGTTYRAEGTYRYSYRGQSYSGSRLGLSALGGADNIDDWHEAVNARLESARKARQPITVWVNPASPAEAVYDRGIRWAELLFLTPFSLAFGGVGVGALVVMAKVLLGDTKGPGRERTQEATGRAMGTAGRGSQSSARFLWIFAFFWNAISFPIAILALRDIADSGEWLGLLVLLFPLVGVLVLWGAIAASWKAFKARRGGARSARGSAPDTFDRAKGFGSAAAARLELPETLAEVEDRGSTLSIRYRTRRRLGLAIALVLAGTFLALVGVMLYFEGSGMGAAALVAIGAVLGVSGVGMLVGRLALSAKAGELTVERRTLAGTGVHRVRAGEVRAIRPALAYSINEEPYYSIVADLGAGRLTLGNSIPGEELANAVARRIREVVGVGT
jgi:hypothetical protein